LDPRIV
jgi:hypothetical protein